MVLNLARLLSRSGMPFENWTNPDLDKSLNSPPAAGNPAEGSRLWKRYYEEIKTAYNCCLVKAGAKTYFKHDLKSPFIKSHCMYQIFDFRVLYSKFLFYKFI